MSNTNAEEKKKQMPVCVYMNEWMNEWKEREREQQDHPSIMSINEHPSQSKEWHFKTSSIQEFA